MKKTTFCVVLMLLSVFLGYVLGLFHQAAQAKHREAELRAELYGGSCADWED